MDIAEIEKTKAEIIAHRLHINSINRKNYALRKINGTNKYIKPIFEHLPKGRPQKPLTDADIIKKLTTERAVKKVGRPGKITKIAAEIN